MKARILYAGFGAVRYFTTKYVIHNGSPSCALFNAEQVPFRRRPPTWTNGERIRTARQSPLAHIAHKKIPASFGKNETWRGSGGGGGNPFGAHPATERTVVGAIRSDAHWRAHHFLLTSRQLWICPILNTCTRLENLSGISQDLFASGTDVRRSGPYRLCRLELAPLAERPSPHGPPPVPSSNT